MYLQGEISKKNYKSGSGSVTEWYSHKVLTYVEYRAVPGVSQNENIDPHPPPSPPSECVKMKNSYSFTREVKRRKISCGITLIVQYRYGTYNNFYQ
jgi:hypothetical protein